ncbi:hypothetical protein E3N88_38530 [Mikania micrantha]|uniref:Uncharacterized protein n=1 Tax=Mikania micrantha TaxID=192012 RepID=A0A5N6LUA1_9ASTR|nr:hypothetical protein E3N88_38530 [Mikania micrantha]
MQRFVLMKRTMKIANKMTMPLVDKIFIQLLCGFPSSEHDIGPYCAWSKESTTASATPTGTTELSKKSNSTRHQLLVCRSKSSGRDASVKEINRAFIFTFKRDCRLDQQLPPFVFLKSSDKVFRFGFFAWS